jgi:hypothetical protein
MKLILKNSHVLSAAAAGLATFVLAPVALAQAGACEALDLPGEKLFGAGGSAVTPTLALIAEGLAGLPEEERINIFWADGKAACGGLAYWQGTDTTPAVYKYWDENGTQATCTDSPALTKFAHMGNTPALCPGNPTLAAGTTKIVAPVMTLDFITDYASTQRTISKEALYYILGLGPGAAGREVVPWTNINGIFSRTLSSFVAQFASGAIGVPAASFKILNDASHLFQQNSQVVDAVAAWANPEEALGFVSGSNATQGYNAQKTRTLAYQHSDQTCAYLPDSEEGRPDRANVRSGQYYVWTPAWFYTEAETVDGEQVAVDESVQKLISWFNGSLETPDDYVTIFNKTPAGQEPGPTNDIVVENIQETIVLAGDVPLCAMRAMRFQGDFSAISSYAPEEPCNGWYEKVALGEETHEPCASSETCEGYEENDEGEPTGEQCRFGFCEAY